MPSKPFKPCLKPGCNALINTGSYCEKHMVKREHTYDEKRESSSERGYNARWRKARETYLKRNPLCVKCLECDLYVRATVVDHIKPHKGDSKLFWDTKNNWQPLCKRCHDIKTAKEDGGFGNSF